MRRVLMTGFEPFDGRSCNASWIAASSVAGATPPDPGLSEADSAGATTASLSAAQDANLHLRDVELRAALLPVCWGEPRSVLEPLVASWRPDCLVGLGEGEAGVFKLETVARNCRRERPDNANRLPHSEPVDPTGPALRRTTADCAALADALALEGIPVQLSEDAGAFLCEELLYTLEGLKARHDFIRTVLFMHVPPFDTELVYRGTRQRCTASVLQHFTETLLRLILDTHPLRGASRGQG